MLAFFGLLAGYFFYVYVAIFRRSERAVADDGPRSMPMDVNEWVIRPLLANLSVIGLFLIPMITMRLSRKRSGPARSSCWRPRPCATSR